MKLSFNSWAYSSFPVWLPAYPIEYVIRSLARIGYDGVELGCASPVAYPPYMTREHRARIKGLLQEEKIEVSSVLPVPGGAIGNNVASPIEAEREQAVQSYKDSVDLASDLGGRICLYIAGWVVWGCDKDRAWEWSRTALRDIAAHAKTRDVVIAVEPTPADSNLIESADDALKLMRESGMDNVGVMFDTFHVHYRQEVPTDYVDKMGDNLLHVHISDADRRPPGSSTDFSLLIDALKSIGYGGYLAMEIGFSSRAVHPNSYAKQSFDYMKGII